VQQPPPLPGIAPTVAAMFVSGAVLIVVVAIISLTVAAWRARESIR
jgi:hypothetical protein